MDTGRQCKAVKGGFGKDGQRNGATEYKYANNIRTLKEKLC